MTTREPDSSSSGVRLSSRLSALRNGWRLDAETLIILNPGASRWLRECAAALGPFIAACEALEQQYADLAEATTPKWEQYDHAMILSLARCNKQDADSMDDADGNPEKAWEARCAALEQQQAENRARWEKDWRELCDQRDALTAKNALLTRSLTLLSREDDDAH